MINGKINIYYFNTYQQQKEHCESDENIDGQRDFFTRLGGQIEDENGEEGNADAGKHQVDGVEQRLTTECQIELQMGKK